MKICTKADSVNKNVMKIEVIFNAELSAEKNSEGELPHADKDAIMNAQLKQDHDKIEHVVEIMK